MDTRRISDLDVTIVGIGCNNFGRRLDKAGAGAVVHAALEAGSNLFDTADVYGDGTSEEYLDKALSSCREEVILATKFGVQLGDDPGRGGAPPVGSSGPWRTAYGGSHLLGPHRTGNYRRHDWLGYESVYGQLQDRMPPLLGEGRKLLDTVEVTGVAELI